VKWIAEIKEKYRGGLYGDKKNPSGIEDIPRFKNKPSKGKMKKVASPAPIRTKECEEMVQLASWEKSTPWWFSGQRGAHIGTEKTTKMTPPIKINNKIFFPVKCMRPRSLWRKPASDASL
jgi:hypothetical protein